MKVAAVQGDKADLVLLQKDKESLKRQQREGDSLYKNTCTLLYDIFTCSVALFYCSFGYNSHWMNHCPLTMGSISHFY